MTDAKRAYNRREVIGAAGVLSTVGFAGCIGGSSGSGGTEYPSRDLEVVVGYGAGGGTDTLHRGIARPAESILQERGNDVSINVSNITGARSLNSANYVLEQPADGYTIWANTMGIAANIANGNASFTIDDWQPLMQIQHDTSWMFTSGREGNGVDDIDELISIMDSNSSQATIGVVGQPSSATFVLQWTNALDLLDGYRLVSYDDAGRMRTDTMSGELDASFGEIQELTEQYESGDVELILVGVEESIDEFPDVPTVADIGAPDATYGVSRGVALKSGVQQERVDYLHELYQEAMESEEYQQLEEETMVHLREGYLPPEEYRQQIQRNIEVIEQSIEWADQVQAES